MDDDLPFGIVAADYTDKDGKALFDLEPGSYQVSVFASDDDLKAWVDRGIKFAQSLPPK